MRKPRDAGFTLIELMIVIAVIGILSVTLIPKVSNVKVAAKNTGVLTNLKSVQTYLVGNIDRWITSPTSNQTIAADIETVFAGDQALQNPFSGSTTVYNGLSGSDTFSDADALVLLNAAPTDNTIIPAGGVVVVIPNNFTTYGFTVTGYDNNKLPIQAFPVSP